MKKTLVCGAGGFIGGHLVKKLKREGYWVRGVDIKEHEYAQTQADEFLLLDLREDQNCKASLSVDGGFDEAVPAGSRHGRDGFYFPGRVRDHAQQRFDKYQHGP